MYDILFCLGFSLRARGVAWFVCFLIGIKLNIYFITCLGNDSLLSILMWQLNSCSDFYWMTENQVALHVAGMSCFNSMWLCLVLFILIDLKVDFKSNTNSKTTCGKGAVFCIYSGSEGSKLHFVHSDAFLYK